MTSSGQFLSVAIGSVAALLALPASAQTLTVDFTIPRLSVAEYHNPYVAIWIEDANGKAVKTLAVRYDVDLHKQGKEDGRKWLSDLRAWWRKTGRAETMPADGVSGPTQPPGRHRVSVAARKSLLGDLPAGNYRLLVEAAREVGGREVVTVPFAWPPRDAKRHVSQGKSELGAVELTLNR